MCLAICCLFRVSVEGLLLDESRGHTLVFFHYISAVATPVIINKNC